MTDPDKLINLTSSTQEVLNAAMNVRIDPDWWPDGIPELVAAALRAAADQFSWDEDFTGMCCCEHLKAIAAELEAQ